jgi:hypothetical protein
MYVVNVVNNVCCKCTESPHFAVFVLKKIGTRNDKIDCISVMYVTFYVVWILDFLKSILRPRAKAK